MKCIEIKIYLDKTKPDLTTEMVAHLDLSETRSIHANFIPSKAIEMLESAFDCTAREGITGGCYGARDGKSYEGVTLWVHPKEMDYKYGELFNPWHSIINSGGSIVEGLDGDSFEEACENLGLELRRDNSCNFDSNFLFEIDFSTIGQKNGDGPIYLSVKFHCGGDVRGNYTDKMVFKFDSSDDLYSAIFPSNEE